MFDSNKRTVIVPCPKLSSPMESLFTYLIAENVFEMYLLNAKCVIFKHKAENIG